MTLAVASPAWYARQVRRPRLPRGLLGQAHGAGHRGQDGDTLVPQAALLAVWITAASPPRLAYLLIALAAAAMGCRRTAPIRTPVD